MPNITDRQSAQEALEVAYFASLADESDAMLVDSDTSSSLDGSHESSSSSSEDMPVTTTSEILLDTLGDLYLRCYLNDWQSIERLHPTSISFFMNTKSATQRSFAPTCM